MDAGISLQVEDADDTRRDTYVCLIGGYKSLSLLVRSSAQQPGIIELVLVTSAVIFQA